MMKAITEAMKEVDRHVEVITHADPETEGRLIEAHLNSLVLSNTRAIWTIVAHLAEDRRF